MPKPGTADLSLYAGKGAIIEGLVLQIDQPDQIILATTKMIFPDRRNLDGKTLLRVKNSKTQLQVGQFIRAKVKVVEIPAAMEPWQFDTKKHLAKKNIFCSCNTSSLQIVPRTSGSSFPNQIENALRHDCLMIDAKAQHAREIMVEAHRKNIGKSEGDLLSSMVLGDRAVSLDDSIVRTFRDVGLSHILAASGFNLTIVTGVTFWIIRLLTSSILILNSLCFSAMLCFVVLAGPSASVLRAALMCTFLLGTRCSFRSIHASAAMSAALLVTLLADPKSITDVGLQLSYASTAGIMAGAGKLTSLFMLTNGKRIWKWFAETFSLVILAQASVMPIQLLYFWRTGLLFLPANLLVDPLVASITIFGFISSLLCFIPVQLLCIGYITHYLATVVDWCTLYPLKLMMIIAAYLASIDQAKVALGPPLCIAVGVYYVAFATLLKSIQMARYRLLSSVFFVIGILFLLWRPTLPLLTVACFSDTYVFVDQERNRVIIAGSQKQFNTKLVERFLSYYAVGKSVGAFQTQSLSQEGIYMIENKVRNLNVLLVSKLDFPNESLKLPDVPEETKLLICCLKERLLSERKRRQLDAWISIYQPNNVLKVSRAPHAMHCATEMGSNSKAIKICSAPGIRAILEQVP
jgi:ComEC/Rec2-related protein